MPRKIFPRDNWVLAQTLSELVYCNPFEDRRWELERECLGDDYQEGVAYLAPGELETLLAPNLSRLFDIALALMESAREKLAKAANVDTRELEVYVNLTHFVVYHEFMERFDGLVEKSLNGKPYSNQVKFYYEYRARQRYFMSLSAATRFSPDQEVHFFAMYFQIRRAWLNIYGFIVGGSEAIRMLRERIWNSCFTHDMRRYQRSLYSRMDDIVTLITGPSGTGKELVARAVGMSRFVPFDEKSGKFAIDFASGFYPLNLSALSPTLIESELFGHRKGAFTGALQDRDGYFDKCGPYGTVFLDEVGETDSSIQVKLLRVLQTRQFQRLGDTQLRPFVGKVMAATNRDLPEEINNGTFREDFYFRLCADQIRTPKLKDVLSGGSSELEMLVKYISMKFAGPDDGLALTDEACTWIKTNLGSAYQWSGNFRELEQCVRNIMIHGNYEPEVIGVSRDHVSMVKDASEKGLTANQLLSLYAGELYRMHGSYEETAKLMQVDRRTAKRYVLGVQ